MFAVKAVVFDIDDTLYLERDYVRSGFCAVDRWCRDQLKRSGFGVAAWELFEQGERGDIFDRVLQNWGLPVEPLMICQLISAYREHDPEIALLPDAVECLSRLRGHVKMAAVSDGPLASQQAKAHRLGLYQTLDEVLLTASLGTGFEKPHPEAFLRVQSAFRCRGPQCVYLADNPAKDFQAPERLGWRTIRVRRPGSLHAESPCSIPNDLVVEDLYGVPSLLGC